MTDPRPLSDEEAAALVRWMLDECDPAEAEAGNERYGFNVPGIDPLRQMDHLTDSLSRWAKSVLPTVAAAQLMLKAEREAIAFREQDRHAEADAVIRSAGELVLMAEKARAGLS